MIVVAVILLLELPLTAKSYDVVLDRELEILPIHSRKFSFEHDLFLVFVYVYAGIPGAAANPFFAEAAGKIGREEAVNLLLKAA
jgi:hypothetical protein